MGPDEQAACDAFVRAQWRRLVRAGVVLGLDLHAADVAVLEP